MTDTPDPAAVPEEDWYSDAHATFGDRLVAAREAAELSQKGLAKRLGVKPKTIVGWENDVSEPRANRLQMLAGLLNVSLMWLINGEGEGVPPPSAASNVSPEARALLLELRDLRADLVRSGEELARIEKRLRKLFETGAP